MAMRPAWEVDLCHVRAPSHLASRHTPEFSFLCKAYFARHRPGNVSSIARIHLAVLVLTPRATYGRYASRIAHSTYSIAEESGLWNLSLAVGHLARSACARDCVSLSSVLYSPCISRWITEPREMMREICYNYFRLINSFSFSLSLFASR